MLWVSAEAQGLTRELRIASGGGVEIVNKYGRVAVRAEPAAGDKPVAAKVTASSSTGVSGGEIKLSDGTATTVISVQPVDKRKRIDLVLVVSERLNLKVETAAGAVDISGNFASVEALTDTGTITTDVPADDLTYHFLWTESKPRYVADFDIAKVKEKAAGRFEIRGKHTEEGEKEGKGEGEKRRKGEKETSDSASPSPTPESEKPKTKDQKPKTVSLNFTTARGIILLNVPPNEVMSDLRERPLTEAAKAIIRSGDSLLMEAIRRASPKYFGDCVRTLPPVKMAPAFSPKTSVSDSPLAPVKTALVRVSDLKNRSIAGLEAKDFEVTEGGSPREILKVEQSTAPFNLALLLDVSGSVENYVTFIRKAARNFVNTVGKNDRVSIVIFNDDVKVISKFTTDKGKLSQSLDTFDAGGATAYYDALAYVISDTLRPLKGDRTAVVILTDGDDNRSFLAFDSLIGSIQESGALIYPLYVPSLLIAEAAANADIDPIRRKYISLTAKATGEGDKLARVSGGVYYQIEEIPQIQQAYEDIVLQLRSAYNITYRSDVSAVTGSGISPRLKIKAKKENTFVTVNSVVAER